MAMVGATSPFLLAGCGGFSSLTEGGAKAKELLSTFSLSRARGANVLFICIDDLNDWVNGFNGYTGKVHTPNLDRLARMGVTFQNAYCPIPWCAPSRAATLTGLAPTRTRYYGAPEKMGLYPAFNGVQTLPQFFQTKGFKTYGGGKVFHGQYYYGPGSSKKWDACGQEGFGWSEYLGFVDEPRPPENGDKPNNGLDIKLSQFDWTSNFQPNEEAMPDKLIANWAANILKQPSAQRFFLAPGFYRPHLPWYAPKKYYDMYPLSDIQIPPHLLQDDLADVPAAGAALSNPGGDHAKVVSAEPVNLTRWREAVQAYLATISFTDACIGVVLDALLSGPHAETTTIVLWSDNGFQLGEKRGWRKFKLWEKSARVPLIIVTPGRDNAGTVCRKPVSLMDLFPTLADLCFQSVPGNLDGNSLVPLLKNPNATWTYGAVTAYSQNNDGTQVHRSVRTETHRYILYFDGSEELYDHRKDPNELTNLLHPSNNQVAAARPIANAMKAMLPKTA
jgi:arylsulfatase A-like enzyme